MTMTIVGVQAPDEERSEPKRVRDMKVGEVFKVLGAGDGRVYWVVMVDTASRTPSKAYIDVMTSKAVSNINPSLFVKLVPCVLTVEDQE